MLGQIIFNTPLWVWALLAFLIYRGIRAAADREIPLGKVFIIPLVMLGLSLYGIASAFVTSLEVMLAWLASAVVAGTLAWQFFGQGTIVAHPGRRALFQRGSWVPLVLMMGIFFTKYVVAVMLVLNPHYAQHAGFAIAISGLYGMFNGIFIGNLLRTISIYRRAHSGLHTMPFNSSGNWGSQKF